MSKVIRCPVCNGEMILRVFQDIPAFFMCPECGEDLSIEKAFHGKWRDDFLEMCMTVNFYPY